MLINFTISICILLTLRKFMSGDKVLSGNLKNNNNKYVLFLMYLSLDFIACQINYLIKLSQFNRFIGSIFYRVLFTAISCYFKFYNTNNTTW